MKLWREVDGLLLREAADHANEIRAAIGGQVDVDAIVAQWVALYPEGGKVAPAEARAWTNAHFNLPTRQLETVIDHLLATGYVLGQDLALAAYAQARLAVNKAPSAADLSSAVSTDWANWKAGNKPAAALVRPPGRLANILANGKASIKDMNEVTLNRVGTLLADSLQAGQGYSTVARQLLTDNITSRIVQDSSRANTIAITEMSRAMNLATMDSYQSFGVEMVEWLALEPCDDCELNVEDGAIPLGEEFTSGDTEPPAHPNCRCSLIPVVDEGAAPVDGGDNTDVTDEGDLVDGADVTDTAAEMEISDVADHAINDVAATTAETSVADLPTLDQMFDPANSAGDAQALLQNVYGSRDFNGFKVEIYDATRFKEGGLTVIKADGRIFAADGTRAGSISRTFRETATGIRSVEHDFLRLTSEYRGLGFASKFSQFSEDYYRANGISKIEIFAALENGGYTWAKAGYEFDAQPYNVIDRISDKMTMLANAADNRVHLRGFDGQITKEEAQSLADRLATLESNLRSGVYSDPNYPKPFDIANMEGPELFGKSFGRWLLDGTSWQGVKKL